jgi:hypothetical protein
VTLGEFGHSIVKLPTHHEIDSRGGLQTDLGQRRHMGTDEGDLDLRSVGLDPLGEPNIARKTGRTGIKDDKLVVLSDRNSVVQTNPLCRAVEKSARLYQAGWIGQPYRIPEGIDFTGRLISCTGPTVAKEGGLTNKILIGLSSFLGYHPCPMLPPVQRCQAFVRSFLPELLAKLWLA